MYRWLCGALSILLSAIALGCGGQTDSSAAGGHAGSASGGTASGGTSAGGSSGFGGTRTGGGGSAGTVPAGGSGGMGGSSSECSVPVTEPGPYPTTIEFYNPISEPLYVSAECALKWDLYACADGYKTPIPHQAGCSTECPANDQGCVMCDPCPISQQPVGPGESVTEPWNGMTFSFENSTAGCPCYIATAAPPAKYAVKVLVSSNIAESPWEVWGYFDLPAPGVVKVPLVNTK